MHLQYEGNITVKRSLGAPLEVTSLLTIRVAVFRFTHRLFLCIYKTALPHEMVEKHVMENKEVAKLSLAWFSSLDSWVVPLRGVNAAHLHILYTVPSFEIATMLSSASKLKRLPT